MDTCGESKLLLPDMTSSSTSQREVTLLTPCYARDIDRLRYLRQSIVACGIHLPHVIVVPDADFPLFASYANAPNVSVYVYSDVLPESLLTYLASGPRWFDHIRGRRYGGGMLRVRWGWMQQQYVKLAAGTVVDTDTWICVDSDIAFIKWVGAESFTSSSGDPLLLELHNFPLGKDGESVVHTLRASSCRMLGLPSQESADQIIYSGWLVPFQKRIAGALIQYIDERYRQPWWASMARFGASEYESYGLFARHIYRDSLIVPEDRRWCWLFYSLDSFDGLLRYAVEDVGVAAVMIDAHLSDGVDTAMSRIATYWRN